jgi:hypothetical protein
VKRVLQASEDRWVRWASPAREGLWERWGSVATGVRQERPVLGVRLERWDRLVRRDLPVKPGFPEFKDRRAPLVRLVTQAIVARRVLLVCGA